MRTSFLLLGLLLVCKFTFAQTEFSITSEGLSPELIRLELPGASREELFQKTNQWIQKNQIDFKLSIEEQEDLKEIVFSSIKNNGVNLGERYFHAKYQVNVLFEDEMVIFSPTQVQLKVNSKYDMGWEDFDMKSPDEFFKKGKVLRKYKDYIEDLVMHLNALAANYATDLRSE